MQRVRERTTLSSLGRKKKRATQQFSLATAFWKCCAVRQNNDAPLRTSRKKGEKKKRERENSFHRLPSPNVNVRSHIHSSVVVVVVLFHS